MRPFPLFPACDDTRIAQDLHMIWKGWLGHIHFIDQDAGTLLTAVQQLQYPLPPFITKGLEYLCSFLICPSPRTHLKSIILDLLYASHSKMSICFFWRIWISNRAVHSTIDQHFMAPSFFFVMIRLVDSSPPFGAVGMVQSMLPEFKRKSWQSFRFKLLSRQQDLFSRKSPGFAWFGEAGALTNTLTNIRKSAGGHSGHGSDLYPRKLGPKVPEST